MSLKLILTALPNGINPANKKLRVSVAISIQVPDALPGAKLGQYPDLMNWPKLVNKAVFRINNIEAKRVSKDAEEDLWKNLFTAGVNVRSFTQPDKTNTPILSYPVKHIVNYIKQVTQFTGKQFFNDMPDAGYYTENPAFTAISNYQVIGQIPKRGRKEITLDDIASDARKGELVKRRMNERPFIPFNGKAEPATDFAQLNNFHGVYSAKPVNHFTQFPKPEFEFHDILSVLNQYHTLQRKLGLVIDLEFDSPVTAPLSTVQAWPSGFSFSSATEIVVPATAAETTATGFYTKADAGSMYEKGYVKINNDNFTVFQLDADGSALKLTSHMDALQLKKARHILYASKNNVTDIKALPLLNNELQPRREGLPSARTAGISVAKNGLAEYLSSRFVRMNELKTLFSPVTPPAGISNTNASYKSAGAPLFADDVVVGYRLDVRSKSQPDWLSVHFTNNTYSYKNTSNAVVNIPVPDAEEGFIQLSTTEDKNIEGPHMKLSEVIARWEGWSLAAPPAGKGMNEPMLSNKEVEDTDADEKKKFETPGSAPFKLNVLPKVAKGSLPKLRFGEIYTLKMRTVDLAGNSVSFKQNPENPSAAVVAGIRYLRYEPTDAPFLVYGNTVKDGESSEVMVIRSNEGEKTYEYESKWPTHYKDTSIRHVKPPRTVVGTAVTHGMLDSAVGKDATAAAAMYNKIVPNKDPFTPASSSPDDAKVINGDSNIKEVEYLTDPLAAGVVFYISPLDINPKVPGYDYNKLYKRISFYDDAEVITDSDASKPVDAATWMNPKTFRIVLQEGSLLDIEWISSERKLVISMAKSLQLKLNYACWWRPDDILKKSGMLDQLGYTGFVDDASKAFAAGKHWMISPWRVLSLVHAVQQPLSKYNGVAETLPLLKQARTFRNYGDTDAALSLQIKLHGFSTGQADVEATWKDIEDDGITLSEKGYAEIENKAKAHHYASVYGVNDYVFGDFPELKITNNPFKALHHFNDTRHRWVDYKIIASTRYKENFFNLIKEKGDAFPITRDGNTLKRVNVLSSVQPLAPQIAYVIPTFEWDRVTKGDTLISGRGSGLRVYLKRPWFSSGEGEKLAVVLKPAVTSAAMMETSSAFYEKYATTWGFDPTKISGTVQGNIFPFKEMFLGIQKGDADNLYTEDGLSVSEASGRVTVVAYDVKFDQSRNMYYADILFNIGPVYFPFVRLALAAYQQHSVRLNERDCCLSKIVQADYIQIPPPRFSSLKKNGSNITVGISGTLPEFPAGAQYATQVRFMVEPITVPASESVHITTGDAIEAYYGNINPQDVKNGAFLHTHDFKLPPEYATKPYRVRILEYELIPSDPNRRDPYYPGNPTIGQPPGERLVFADVYEVNK